MGPAKFVKKSPYLDSALDDNHIFYGKQLTKHNLEFICLEIAVYFTR